jgi:hypothetical protein
MDPLLRPEGNVVAEHRASPAWRIVAVLLLGIPGVLCTLAVYPRLHENAVLAVPGAVLITACVLVFIQQSKVRVVLRADGVERWGMRGELWTLRWQDAPELRYKAKRVHAVGLDAMLLLKLFPSLGKSINIAFADVNGKRRKLPASLQSMDLVAERVVELHTTTHLPALRSAFDSGEEVRFGKVLALDREQVSVRKLFGGMKRCLLSEVEKVTVGDGRIKIRQKGKTFAFATLAVRNVPNAFLFVKLFESTRTSRPAGTPPATGTRGGWQKVG